ncbi:type II toxin-antitoxin system HicA family toxin [Anaerovibrio slackiae]|uniref:type II toxin-antitoxin system HicA family toxin n=1 Tax=Anaerovibrio slackiae TaxID=2652309 RepID=UPI002E25755E
MPEGVGCHEAAPKDLIRILKDDGWVIDRIKGSHHIMKHPTKPGRPVIPLHNEELKPGTYNNILKQAGLK